MTTITPADIQQGDVLINSDGSVGWVAQQDATTVDTRSGRVSVGIGVQVQHIDGGIDWRYWPTDTDVRFVVAEQVPGVGRHITLAI
jgi:hypothetical protein